MIGTIQLEEDRNFHLKTAKLKTKKNFQWPYLFNVLLKAGPYVVLSVESLLQPLMFLLNGVICLSCTDLCKMECHFIQVSFAVSELCAYL